MENAAVFSRKFFAKGKTYCCGWIMFCMLYLVKVGWTDTSLEDNVTVKDRWINFSHIYPALNCFSGLGVTWQEVPMRTTLKNRVTFLWRNYILSLRTKMGELLSFRSALIWTTHHGRNHPGSIQRCMNIGCPASEGTESSLIVYITLPILSYQISYFIKHYGFVPLPLRFRKNPAPLLSLSPQCRISSNKSTHK